MSRSALLAALAAAVAIAGCGGSPAQPLDDRTLTDSAGSGPATADEAADPVLVAALGDSITAGSPLWDPDARLRRQLPAGPDPRSQYEYWAERELGETVRFRNCGVFGERTDEIARRLEDCARQAEALIVQGGINDIAQGRPIEDAARDLQAIVRRGKELGLRTAIVDVLPWNNGYPDAAPEIRELNRSIAAIGEREHVRVLPFYATLEDPAAPGRMAPDLTIDGDHPSIAGYRRLGELIRVP